MTIVTRKEYQTQEVLFRGRFDSKGVFDIHGCEEGVPNSSGKRDCERARLTLICQSHLDMAFRLAGLEVVKEDLEASGLGTVVGDDDTRAADNLAGLAVTVDLRETSPLAKDLGVRDLDELDVVLGAKSLDELRVLGCGISVKFFEVLGWGVATHPR